MRSNRTFLQEAKALDYLIEIIYLEQKELCEKIEREGMNEINKARLDVINHFIKIYEGF